ncbi:hypothetical protein AB0M28_13440 [Streptomyces sp. NPDC051940]|uniref:hypothetical protein n=1 Tax=Streptomyces sp. NPDC051940 TaxID=3155675 RepID=UPI003435B9E4
MPRLYATPADLGPSPPENAEELCEAASDFLDAEIFRTSLFDADEDGYPSNTIVREAFRRATVAQARWYVKAAGGDPDGASGVGWGTIEIGSAKLSRSVTDVSGSASPAREIAPRVWDVLRSPDLTRDIFVLGVVVSG